MAELKREPLETYHQRFAKVAEEEGPIVPDPKDYSDAMALLEKRIEQLEKKLK